MKEKIISDEKQLDKSKLKHPNGDRKLDLTADIKYQREQFDKYAKSPNEHCVNCEHSPCICHLKYICI